ncbi:flavin reductase [bacterium]|nr:flavin reductase [bacterium]MBP9808907.1 flavin reductase [bacterium]
MEGNFSIARQIACPVVLISSALENGHENTDFYMLSSISYVNLEPLILSTAFLKTSKTAAVALASTQMAVSVLSFQHRKAVAKLESQTSAERDLISASENLSLCGFSFGRLNSGLLYIRDSLLACSLRIFERTELDQYNVVLAKIEERAALNLDNLGDGTEPLIRYNRLYATLDQERLIQGNDRYPV